MANQEAEERARIILEVRSGRMTAEEGAKVLHVSRKTFYQWEKKGLQGLLSALVNGNSGRPAEPVDEEKEALKKEVAHLKQELCVARESVHVRRVLDAYDEQRKKDALKKN
jgi:transposase